MENLPRPQFTFNKLECQSTGQVSTDSNIVCVPCKYVHNVGSAVYMIMHTQRTAFLSLVAHSSVILQPLSGLIWSLKILFINQKFHDYHHNNDKRNDNKDYKQKLLGAEFRLTI
jgi:hypothetical protein